MADSDKEEDVKNQLTALTKKSGIEGAERLAALYIKQHPEEARTMSMSKLKKLSNEILKLGPGKQILSYPQNLSGGRIHASSPNDTWQVEFFEYFVRLQVFGHFVLLRIKDDDRFRGVTAGRTVKRFG